MTDDPFESKLNRLAVARDAVSRLELGLCQMLASRLTKRNFGEMMHRNLKRILPAFKGVDVEHRGFNWEELDPDQHTHVICVCMKQGEFNLLEPIIKFVTAVWPHAVLSAGNADGWYFNLVSKTKQIATLSNEQSVIEEDNINISVQYFAYLLKHNIGHARQLWLAPQREIWQSWLDPATWSPLDEMTGANWLYIASRAHRNDVAFEINRQYSRWSAHYRASMWCNLHDRLLELCFALAPLRLSPYELLWILDWLPPMSFRCYRDGVPYDPNHTLKLRLFESIAESYRKIKSA
jgi:hypothetical protein